MGLLSGENLFRFLVFFTSLRGDPAHWNGSFRYGVFNSNSGRGHCIVKDRKCFGGVSYEFLFFFSETTNWK